MPGDLDDPVLGKLVWSDEFNWWTVEVELRPGHRIELIVFFDSERDTISNALSRAKARLEQVRQRESEYRRWSAEKLLGGRWNKEEPMTSEDIYQLLNLLSLECSADGTARLYWDDDDVLFFGHGIVTDLDSRGGCLAVGLQS